tara:strand:+ start:201 stop:686 length:486 start_codon:yes stop_codon:yes gene_type:complete
MDIHLIWAQDINGGIGKEGRLPWYISEDLKKFKETTLNSTIIMGRKTWNSLKIQPLPKRRNIVLSTKSNLDVETYNSITECINNLKKEKLKKVFVIGGSQIYKEFYDFSSHLHITLVKKSVSNIDTFFPIALSKIKINYKKIYELELKKNVLYTEWKRKNS